MVTSLLSLQQPLVWGSHSVKGSHAVVTQCSHARTYAMHRYINVVRSLPCMHHVSDTMAAVQLSVTPAAGKTPLVTCGSLVQCWTL